MPKRKQNNKKPSTSSARTAVCNNEDNHSTTSEMFDSPETLLEGILSDPSTLDYFSSDQLFDIVDMADKLVDKRSFSRYHQVIKLANAKNRLLTRQQQSQSENEIERLLHELDTLKAITIKIDKKVDTLTQLHQQPQPSTSNPNTANGKTFAQVIKNPNAVFNASKTYLPPKTNEQTTIIVKAMQPNSISPKMIEANTKQIINQTSSNCKITKISANKSAVVIQSAETSQEKVTKLIDNLNNHRLNQNKFRAKIPKKLDPLITIKDVSKDNNIATIAQQIIEHNPELGNEKDVKFAFTTHSHLPNHFNIVCRVSPAVFSIINDKLKNRIFIDFQSCKIEHRIFVKQCQNCFLFSHKTGECRNTKVCKNCGQKKDQNHHCSSEQRCCTNCNKSQHYKNDTKHLPNTELCPIYKAQMIKQFNQTQFFPVGTYHQSSSRN
ncbi:hypothetical protein QR98_0043000 [Sarcoptes scabiei]|uniref:Uncharacterized protein n=1 Tax=Sarcoptes scabiei TaxID=52283 RepID=A0A132A4C5_SARSC|nr:hypothetical protein QR98_0043000 [Sarcoptes scabiei]